MNRGNIYASTADILSKTNVEEVMKSAKKFATKLSNQDMFGIFIFYALLPMGFLYTIVFPLALWFEIYSNEWLIRVIPLLFCIFNVYFNAVKIVKNGANSPDGSLLPSIQKFGFRFCHECQMNSPPRSFHCPVCNICILRRDHHCSFVGKCVGHFNQRYFIASICNLWAVTFACFTWNMAKMFEVFPDIRLIDFWKLMFPHVAFTFRFISLNQFLMVAAFAFSLVTFFFTTYLISAQLFCFSRGQTRVEYLMDIHAYNLGLWENISQGLGRKWLLALIWPFVDSPLKSDGLSFQTRERESVGKSAKTF